MEIYKTGLSVLGYCRNNMADSMKEDPQPNVDMKSSFSGNEKIQQFLVSGIQ